VAYLAAPDGIGVTGGAVSLQRRSGAVASRRKGKHTVAARLLL